MHVENQQTDKIWFSDELQRYQQSYDYDDMLIIAKDGDIIYSVEEREDLTQNVLRGKLKNTHLNQAFKKGMNGITIQDFAPYPPINNQYLLFIAAPIFHNDELAGVLIFSILPKMINEIINRNDGIGGETYLVGRLNEQTSYRSDRIVKNGKIGSKKTGADIEQALAGQSGVEIKIGSTGNLEITTYAPLQIPDLNWCIITTIQLEEILAPKLINEREDFFTKYIHQYGYYDLFLIQPQGQIFYSIEHESDYLTNILTGKYANSNLGKLIKKVIQTKVYGVSDFAPYAPSNNEPAACSTASSGW